MQPWTCDTCGRCCPKTSVVDYLSESEQANGNEKPGPGASHQDRTDTSEGVKIDMDVLSDGAVDVMAWARHWTPGLWIP